MSLSPLLTALWVVSGVTFLVGGVIWLLPFSSRGSDDEPSPWSRLGETLIVIAVIVGIANLAVLGLGRFFFPQVQPTRG